MSEDLEKTLAEVQIHNQQLQEILRQKQLMAMQKAEIEKALEELEKSDDNVYRSLGPILIKQPKETVKKDLEEMVEQMDVRTKSLDKQEERIKESMKSAQSKLQSLIKRPSGSMTAA
jgi:prefoldin beta subunit